MAIYRGAGGAGDAVGDSASEALLVRELAIEVQADADAAEAAKIAAIAAQAAAETAETNAETAETNAETAETNAETAATAAASSASAASTSATNAASSASAASTSATSAASSASAAATSASGASTSATNAASSATSASNSASSASTSATNAASSASTASTQATNAASSATAAASSATSAATSATNAANSATSAAGSATTATTQAGIATTQATNAAASASAAATSASSAATSSTNAANSASAAASSATNASNSASAAATSATNAANSAIAADASADAAALSETNAAASAASINLSSIAITGGSINGTTVGATTPASGAFTTLSASGAFSANGGATLGDASGDALTINSSAVSIPNGLNFDSNTFVIDATNNRVGVGVASPRQAFHVSGGDTTVAGINGVSKGIRFDFSSTTSVIAGVDNTFAASYQPLQLLASTLSFNNAAGEAMRIDSSGNVGIGTSSPDIFGRFYTRSIGFSSSGTTALQINGTSYGTIDLGSNGTRTSSYTASGTDVQIGTLTSIPLIFYTSGSERMRIDSSGNLLVGTTTAQAKGTFLTTSQTTLDVGRTETTLSNNIILRNGNGAVGSIQTNGSSTSYNTSSDYRLKENIAPMTGALDKVSLLKPVTYTWKIDGSDGQGFIAHELAEVVPQCVGGEKDAVDEEGKPVYQGIDTSFLVGVLTASIQELKAIVDAQAERIAVLENK